MAEESHSLRSIDYRQVLPWTYLFRTFRLAIDFRKILLASIAVLLIAAGDWVFVQLPLAPGAASNAGVITAPLDRVNDATNSVVWPWQRDLEYRRALNETTSVVLFPGGRLQINGDVDAPWARLPAIQMLRELVIVPISALWNIATNWQLPLLPVQQLAGPAIELFEGDRTWSSAAFAWTRILWTLIVWALFAVALTRMAAVQFARSERISTRSAMRFAGGKFLSGLTAPLLPTAGLIVVWIVLLGLGLLGRIPGTGEALVGGLGFVAVIFGLVGALLVAGLLVGWPLMYPTIGVEASDAFDGFSRSFSYVYGKPWHYLWLAVLAMGYGSIVIFVVWLIVSLIAYLTGWGISSGLGIEATGGLFQSIPATLGGTVTAQTDMTLGARLMNVWLNVLATAVIGFIHSYFWCAATIAYFLLRKADDATNLDEVFFLDDDDEDELLPVVGVAASEQPVIERPAVGVSGPDGKEQAVAPVKESP